MEEKDYVTCEAAKLLAEKGYNGTLYNRYYVVNDFYRGKQYEHQVLMKRGRILDKDEIFAFDISDENLQHGVITLYDAQKWLREEYKLLITPFSKSQESWMFRITRPHQDLKDGVYGEDFASYEEALNEGIKKALELI